jgi:hypothetical protein
MNLYPANDGNMKMAKKPWNKPVVKSIAAGSAENRTTNFQSDGTGGQRS